MRIVHLTSNDARTAGAKALARLSTELRLAGHDSRVLVGARDVADEARWSMPESMQSRALDKGASTLGEAIGLQGFIRPGFRLTLNGIQRLAPDVVHIHWTYGRRGIPLEALPRLTASFPTVWTFHDMWAFTGGCTNSRGCNGWLSDCQPCPLVGVDSMVTPGLGMVRRHTQIALWGRRLIYGRSRFVAVGPSRWMTDQARRSPLLTGQEKAHIPNGVDLNLFAPRDRRKARGELGMPADGSVILFVGKPDSILAYSDRIPILVASLQALAATDEIESDQVRLLLVGDGARSLAARLPFAAHCMAGVSEDTKMGQCYAAADVLLTTTQFDNYPGVVQESLASGRPVVASRVGGVPELVQHGVTGWLCDPTRPVEFAAALAQALVHPGECAAMGRRSREFAVRQFDQTAVVSRMVDLYEETIAARRGGVPILQARASPNDFVEDGADAMLG